MENKIKKIKKILKELIKETNSKSGARLIGESYVMWRIIPQVKRCKTCKRKL